MSSWDLLLNYIGKYPISKQGHIYSYWGLGLGPNFWESLLNTLQMDIDVVWILEKAREFQKNIYFCFIDYTKAFDCVDHNKLQKILKLMGIPNHLTCLMRNLYTGQEATVRIRHGTMTWFQIGKRVHQDCILSPYLFNLYTEVKSC